MTQVQTLPPRLDAEDAAHVAYSRRNALHRLIRCLFAEGILDKRLLMFSPHGPQACFPLWQKRAVLFFENLQRAPADTYLNLGDLTLVEATGARRKIDTHEALIDLLQDSFDFAPSEAGVAGLKADIANSIRNDIHARQHRRQWNDGLLHQMIAAGAAHLFAYLSQAVSRRAAAIFLDQWGSLEGHPYYPTWKSKPSLSDAEVARLSPEFDARVPVRIAALRIDMAHIERMPEVVDYSAWFGEAFPELWAEWQMGLRAKGQDPAQWLPLPIHGWHLEAFVRQGYAAEIAEGILLLDGPEVETQPTMSFRTMLPLTPSDSPYIKLPVALWMTSEQRSLQAKSIHMGPRISAVIQRILADEQGFGGRLEIFPEAVALHYRHAETQTDAPGRHLSAVFRDSKAAFMRADGALPVPVAALFTALPGSERPFVTAVIEQGGPRASIEQVEAFFRTYARAVARPVIAIYLLYGIALEAHQQNTFALFTPKGEAQGVLIRDFGDGRTYAPLLEARNLKLEPYVYPGILPTVFRDDIEPVRTFVIDAAFVTHLHELALTLTNDYCPGSRRLWDILREETKAAFDAVADRVELTFWQQERAAFLEQPWSTRSVLRMHLLQYSDYRLQHGLTNPLPGA